MLGALHSHPSINPCTLCVRVWAKAQGSRMPTKCLHASIPSSLLQHTRGPRGWLGTLLTLTDVDSMGDPHSLHSCHTCDTLTLDTLGYLPDHMPECTGVMGSGRRYLPLVIVI